MEDVKDVQNKLLELDIDGWLVYEFHGTNPLALDILKISSEFLLTRRLFYWIPKTGTPVKIVHQIEAHLLDHLPGKKRTYLTWKELHNHLKEVLSCTQKIAMEYSPMQAIPTISKVDGGLIDLIRSFGSEIVSSSFFLQEFTCILSDKQCELHKEAAEILDFAVQNAWSLIKKSLSTGKEITEYQVQQFILKEFEKNGCVTAGSPICAVNANSADPHYVPSPTKSQTIKFGDLVLIDLWCKKNVPEGVFADITRMGIAGTKPSIKQEEIFAIVRCAQKEGTDLIENHVREGKAIKGYEVDHKVRQVINEAGYGFFFTHRTGHNIYKENHGPGANLDGLETHDDRLLIPRTCFSIEPGIYLPNEFGVRLEYDVIILSNKTIEITVLPQEHFLIF